MADYELAMDLNLRTVLVTTEAAIPEMRARGGGALFSTASTSGIQGSACSPVYSMAKFGIVGFVRSLAKRLASEKIRVNAICPGPIDTPMLRVFVARPDQQRTSGMDKEQLVVQRGQQNPMRRTGKPEEIANAALFLLSDEASFVSGGALPVDGAATTQRVPLGAAEIVHSEEPVSARAGCESLRIGPRCPGAQICQYRLC